MVCRTANWKRSYVPWIHTEMSGTAGDWRMRRCRHACTVPLERAPRYHCTPVCHVVDKQIHRPAVKSYPTAHVALHIRRIDLPWLRTRASAPHLRTSHRLRCRNKLNSRLDRRVQGRARFHRKWGQESGLRSPTDGISSIAARTGDSAATRESDARSANLPDPVPEAGPDFLYGSALLLVCLPTPV
jgi:hypothetical protein